MRRIASHYIVGEKLYRFHYLQMDGNRFAGLLPLEQEEAGIEFYNGLLWIVAEDKNSTKPWEKWSIHNPDTPLQELLLQEEFGTGLRCGDRVMVYHFPDLSLPASEFCADNGGGNSHIQRLG